MRARNSTVYSRISTYIWHPVDRSAQVRSTGHFCSIFGQFSGPDTQWWQCALNASLRQVQLMADCTIQVFHDVLIRVCVPHQYLTLHGTNRGMIWPKDMQASTHVFSVPGMVEGATWLSCSSRSRPRSRHTRVNHAFVEVFPGQCVASGAFQVRRRSPSSHRAARSRPTLTTDVLVMPSNLLGVNAIKLLRSRYKVKFK